MIEARLHEIREEEKAPKQTEAKQSKDYGVLNRFLSKK
jgi:hypothetical protein